MAGGRRVRSATAAPAGEPIDSDELAAAIEAGAIVPWFHPIVELGTARVVGLEAVARWEHADAPPTAPARFVITAERSDLVRALDWAVISRALANVRGWHAVRPDLRISVNLSARHFDTPAVADTLIAMAGRAGVGHDRIDVELTETFPPGDTEVAQQITARLRAAGFRVWLDDFGSGWNSLTQLLDLSVDGLKIDRAFTAALDTGPGVTIAAAITALAAELGLLVTMEGIETAAQADIARELGCQFGQGYLWSEPMPADLVRSVL